MNRKQKIIISITGIIIVLLALVGLTYAYFLTRITGNTKDKSISVTTAKLELRYGDGNGILEPNGTITPGNDITFLSGTNVVDKKTFTVENKGNGPVNYAVILENLKIVYANNGTIINEEGNEVPVSKDARTEFKYPNEFKISVKCYTTPENIVNEKEIDLTNNTNEILLLNDIEVGEMHTCELKMRYNNASYDQSVDMNKTFTGRINIIDAKDTVDITGTVTNTTGEELYIQTNSIKRVSNINSDGSYKIVGLELGTHKLKACKVSDANCTSPIMEKEIIIKKGETAKVEGNTITITDYSRTSTINVNVDEEKIDIGSEIEKIETDILLNEAIILRANKVSESDSKTKGYAMYTETLRTTPGLEPNAADEALLLSTEDQYTSTTNKPSYYFRGNVTDNYVNYSGMCWRILRIQGDGTIKLILADEHGECDADTYSVNNSNSGLINNGTSYEYSSVGLTGLKFENSYYPNILKEWSEKEIKKEDGTILREHNLDTSKTTVGEWCNDTSVVSEKSVCIIYSDGPVFYYGDTEEECNARRHCDYAGACHNYKYGYDYSYGMSRRYTSPTLKCDMTGINGTKATIYKDNVGIISADEALFAGMWGKDDELSMNKNFLIHNGSNATMSPNFYYVEFNRFDFNYLAIWNWCIDAKCNEKEYEGSNLTYYDFWESNSGSINPAIVLRSDVKVDKNNKGTFDNPYVIKMD